MRDRTIVDCRGLACPQPVIDTKAALEGAAGPLLVVVDNEGSATNVTRFAEGRGARVSAERREDGIHLAIDPGRTAPATEDAPVVCEAEEPGGAVVYVSSQGMGSGDDELGATLMEAFLDTLSQFKGRFTHAVFVNAGAKLAVTESPVLEQLRQIEQTGVRVLVCGTCLRHFGIEDRLAVGTVSNMYEIIETLSAAKRVVRP
jgi:selenium metabolism protein YedF